MIRYAFGNVLGSIWKLFNNMAIVSESVIVFLIHLEMTTMVSDDTYFIFNEVDLIPHYFIQCAIDLQTFECFVPIPGGAGRSGVGELLLGQHASGDPSPKF